MDTDELTRSRLQIALDIVVWAVQNDYPITDEVPASLARNEAEVAILKSLEIWEITQAFALFYETAAGHFQAEGWDKEAVEGIARIGRHADWLTWRPEEPRQRGKPADEGFD